MGANRYMVDAGGVTRHIRTRYVVDSSGVTRLIRKRYIIDSVGAARLTFLYAIPFFGTTGTLINVGGGFSDPFQFGTIGGQPPGVPLNLGGGLFLVDLYTQAGGNFKWFIVDGFASDPGAGWLRSLTVSSSSGTNTVTPSDVGTTYQFGVSGAHAAQWRWPGSFLAFNANSFTGSLQHN